MSALVHLINKRHGSSHVVTSEEWEAMQKKGHGLKIFRVEKEVDIEPQPAPRVREIKVPEEARAILDKRKAPPVVEEIVPHKTEQQAAPVAEEVKAAAPAVAKKRGRKAQTGTATATEGAKAHA